MRHSFTEREENIQFIETYLLKGVESLYKLIREFNVIWEIQIDNITRLYKSEKVLSRKMSKYSSLNQFYEIDRNNSLTNDPLVDLLKEIAPHICQQKTMQYNQLNESIPPLKEVCNYLREEFKNFKNSCFKPGEKCYHEFQKIRKQLKAIKKENSNSMKAFSLICNQNRQANESYKAGKKDTLNALINCCSLKLEIYYATNKQEELLIEFLEHFKRGNELIY